MAGWFSTILFSAKIRESIAGITERDVPLGDSAIDFLGLGDIAEGFVRTSKPVMHVFAFGVAGVGEFITFDGAGKSFDGFSFHALFEEAAAEEV